MPGALKAKVNGEWVLASSASGGGGAEEVYVGPTEPSLTYDIWYDTDAPGITSEDLRWSSAWGVVAVGSFLGGAAYTVPSGTDVRFTNLLAFTSVVGRRYRMRCQIRVIGTTTGNGINLLPHGPDVGGSSWDLWHTVTGTYGYANVEVLFNGGGVAGNYWWGVSHTVNIGFYLDSMSNFYIEDVGPVVGAGVVPQPTAGTEATKPAVPVGPMRYFATDTRRDWLWDGSGWVVMGEPAQAYTPTTTSISFGSGAAVSAFYHRCDGWCDVSIYTSFGTTSAGVITAAGPTWTVPFTGDPSEAGTQTVGSATLYDASGANQALAPYMQTASLVEPRIPVVNGVYVSGLAQVTNTIPVTIAVNDYIRIKLRYRMASRYS